MPPSVPGHLPVIRKRPEIDDEACRPARVRLTSVADHRLPLAGREASSNSAFAGVKGAQDAALRSQSTACGTARAKFAVDFSWREMDSNFHYASTVRRHRATDLPLPPTVKRCSAGRPPPMARPRSEAQRGSVRPAAAMRSTHLEIRCFAAVQAASYRGREARRLCGPPIAKSGRAKT